MAVSPVDIVNVALSLLGAPRLASLNDASRAAVLANAIYETVRDQTLQDAEWSFAQVRQALAQSSTAPVFGFDFQYALPTSPLCLKVNETDPDDAVYTIESDADGLLKMLLTDEPTISIRYTAQITDPSLYSKGFVMALALHLSAHLALPLTGLPTVADGQFKKYDLFISRGMTSDAQQGSTRVADITTLIDVRQHGFESFDRATGKFGF